MRCLPTTGCIVAVILLTGVGFGGCTSAGVEGGGGDRDASVPDDDDGNGPVTGGSGVLIGRVVRVDGDPLAGVAVMLDNGRSASTDDNGFYSFPELNVGDELIAAFRNAGYTPTTKAFTAAAPDAAPLNVVVMAEVAQTVTFDAGSDVTQRTGDAAVTITAGSLVDADGDPVTGDVDLTATFIDPSTDALAAFPGSFDRAENEDGDAVVLETFGFAFYELTQNGDQVDLTPGSTAEIEYVLPDDAQEQYDVGDTIGLWEFDQETATWLEAGQGEVRTASDGSGRLAWFAEVDHFSEWNADEPMDIHCITGRLLHDGDPVFTEIMAVGLTYLGTTITTSEADGTFCIEVKRGSRISLEVTTNLGTVPLATREVTVPDMPASCASGGCTAIGDIELQLDQCVQGLVTDQDGIPVAGARVYVSPGQSVITDADGEYCAGAPPDSKVSVFAEGHASTTVTTASGVGSCLMETCAKANLSITLPQNGQTVGYVTARLVRVFRGGVTIINGTPQANKSAQRLRDTIRIAKDDPTTHFSVAGTFLVAEASELADFTLEGYEIETETIGECTATSLTLSGTGPGTTSDFAGIGALDPGEPGTVSNGEATVNLVPGDPLDFDPPQPFVAGIYTPDTEPGTELADLGFGADQTITVDFPGGTDIGALRGSIELPPELELTSPDPSDITEVALDLNEDLEFSWVTADPADDVQVTVTGFTLADSSSAGFQAVTIQCAFPDTGSGTVPARLMSLLPGDVYIVSLTAERLIQTDAAVQLNRTGGSGFVSLEGSVGVTLSLTNTELDLGVEPEPGGDDLCDFITCPEGEACDPETGMCCDPESGECTPPDTWDMCQWIECPEGLTCNPETFVCE